VEKQRNEIHNITRETDMGEDVFTKEKFKNTLLFNFVSVSFYLDFYW
jgi:hypothetical protein